MDKIETNIRNYALRRIAMLFDVPLQNIKMDDYFYAFDIKNPFFSFKRNALDVVLDDVRDVSDRLTLNKIENDQLSIDTVGEYVEHMVNCYASSPDEVTHILGKE